MKNKRGPRNRPTSGVDMCEAYQSSFLFLGALTDLREIWYFRSFTVIPHYDGNTKEI
jgi:hypothetical protein